MDLQDKIAHALTNPKRDRVISEEHLNELSITQSKAAVQFMKDSFGRVKESDLATLISMTLQLAINDNILDIEELRTQREAVDALPISLN